MATNTAQTSSLHNLLSALERLERALGEDRREQAAVLHALVADERLQRMERLAHEQRHEFDAIDFIGQLGLGSGRALWGPEVLHSNMLAWLLDPNESHGIGERFLKPLLIRAGAPHASQSVDWSAAQVTREWLNLVDEQWGYLDVLIVNEAEQVLCAIEVKTFSSEHDEQLTRYRKALEDAYPTFTRYYVFLTPRGTEPLDKEERAHWTPLTYSAVFEVIQSIVDASGEQTNADVRAFLRQYATTLRRNLVPDTSISQLARRIWLEHREALELLIEHRPNWVEETKPILKDAISRQPSWRLEMDDNNVIRFRSAAWDQYEAMQTGINWAPDSNALLLFGFKFYDGRPYLQLTLSRGGDSTGRLREILFEAVRQNPKLFRLKSTSLSEKWTHLHEDEDYILEKSDYGIGWDDGATRAKLEAWVAEFAATRFPAMNEVILGCLREYEAEE